ncbi:MAG: GTP cyclohydrolase I FolE [Cytophagales bacterium]|jgi:GTP cyclohydrolase I|nr:GTP cyclohydrolase I FolE [Cytophagales bacterium]
MSSTPHEHLETGKIHDVSHLTFDEIGDDHVLTSFDTPLRADAFERDDDLKIELIEKHFREIMHILGLDLTDDSLQGTPRRVAKMYVKEMFGGLNPDNKPSVTLFENKYKYSEMLVEKDISFYSNCEHHFVPIFGKAHVAYVSSGQVIGLSKLNRIVQYYAKRPQVQERLTVQVARELQEVLRTEDVAVVMDAKHLCVASRGVNDITSSTVTVFYGGKFREESTKTEFLKYLDLKTEF